MSLRGAFMHRVVGKAGVIQTVACALLVIAAGCGRTAPAPNPHSGPEARQWLKENGNPHALATNRFDSKQDAVKFVESLYEAGATKVFVPNDSINDTEAERFDGGPYADAVVVEFDPKTAARLVPLLQREIDEQGGGDPFAVPNGWALLWWD